MSFLPVGPLIECKGCGQVHGSLLSKCPPVVKAQPPIPVTEAWSGAPTPSVESKPKVSAPLERKSRKPKAAKTPKPKVAEGRHPLPERLRLELDALGYRAVAKQDPAKRAAYNLAYRSKPKTSTL